MSVFARRAQGTEGPADRGWWKFWRFSGSPTCPSALSSAVTLSFSFATHIYSRLFADSGAFLSVLGRDRTGGG